MAIPGPCPLPIIGNLLNVDFNYPLGSLIQKGKVYGPVYTMTFAGQKFIYVCNYEIAKELYDGARFHKIVTSGVANLRYAAGNGLFTAQIDNHEWEIAHRVLLPHFGASKIRNMFPSMIDIAEQLCLKWARFGPTALIDVSSDFTRLTLDTIALCTMSFRFNSFYLGDRVHPFVEAMTAVLAEAETQSGIPPHLGFLRWSSQAKFFKNINFMTQTCREIIGNRRDVAADTPDLLDAMLTGQDAKTGEEMTEESIINNMITFLIAGHETTSGLLSFVFYFLLENPDALQKAYDEVGSIIGGERILVNHLQQLPFIDAVLKETLRLMPTAPGFFVTPFKTEILGGNYAIHAGEPILALLHLIQRDPAVWGYDAEEFKPERMLKHNFEKLPKNSWKPFGNGKRACIGRAFAWQEAQLIVAMILQNFDISKGDPNYSLQVKNSLTIKPIGFNMLAKVKSCRADAGLFRPGERY